MKGLTADDHAVDQLRRLHHASRRPTNRAPDTVDYRNVLARTMVVQRRVRRRVARRCESENRMDYGGGIGMSKIHVLPDENLGGVLREFIEVERRPNVGEYVLITRFSGKYVNHIAKVTSVDHDLNKFRFSPEIDCYSVIRNIFDYDCGEKCSVLEPTDIVRIYESDDICGVYMRYRLVDRKAKVGEKVIIVETHPSLVYTELGEIVEIIETDGDTCGGMFKPHDIGEKGAVYRFQYLVLEPVEPAEEGDDVLTVDETEASKSVLDLLANLARRVTELEKRVRIIDDYNDVLIDRMNDAEEKIEMILDDIVTLDERTQPLVALVKAVKEVEADE
jgi:hypothetical protein